METKQAAGDPEGIRTPDSSPSEVGRDSEKASPSPLNSRGGELGFSSPESEHCAIEGCDHPLLLRKHGLCGMHYQRARNAGTIEIHRHGGTMVHRGANREWPTACAVEGCLGNGPFVRGWCLSHYRRFCYYGDPTRKRPAPAKRSPRVPEGIENTRDLAKALGVSRQRAHQLLNQDKHVARRRVRDAIKSGVIAQPPFCFRCGNKTEDLEAHHWDYDRPLDVGWFCPKCHSAVHPHARGSSRRLVQP